jgi:hypothetical protein
LFGFNGEQTHSLSAEAATNTTMLARVQRGAIKPETLPNCVSSPANTTKRASACKSTPC